MHTVNIELDVKRMQKETENPCECPKVNFHINGIRLTITLINIPGDQTTEINQLRDTIDELREENRSIETLRDDLNSANCRLQACIDQFAAYRKAHPYSPEELRTAATTHLSAGNVFSAIKAVLEMSSMDCKEANEYCDALQAEIKAYNQLTDMY